MRKNGEINFINKRERFENNSKTMGEQKKILPVSA